MPIAFTRKGRYRLSRDGQEISQHNVVEEAYENALEHAEINGAGIYRVDPPWMEVDVPIITIAQRPLVRPPSAPGFTSPNAPTSVSAAQGSPASSVIRVSFTPGTDTNDPAAEITANRLYGANSSNGVFTLVSTVAGNATFADESGIAESTTRYYKVTTVNAHGLESVLSSEVNATTAASGGDFVEPSNYQLELLAPRASGSSPSADEGTPTFPSGHRCLKAYTGITYTYKCDVIGGSFPYTFSIANNPEGMTINSTTGVITWTNPQSNATPTITVTDAEGTQVTGTPTIVVSTSGFRFVDAVSGSDNNAGTLAAPWQTFNKVMTSSSSGDTVYFRTGTYSTNITPTDTGGTTGEFQPPGNWSRFSLNASQRANQWIAYPGESPVFDGGYVFNETQGIFIRIGTTATSPIYIDGIEFQNYYHMILQIAGPDPYSKFCNLEMHGVGDVIDGSNSACIDSISFSGGAPRWYTIYQDCNFHDNLPGAIKLYWQYKSLWDSCTFIDNGGLSPTTGDRGAGGPDHKAACGRFEVRACLFRNEPSASDVPEGNGATNDSGIGGNQNASNAVPNFAASGEVRYNKVGGFTRPDLRVCDCNNFSNSGEIFFYRNTLVGRVNVQNSGVATCGPFRFSRNLIINDVNAALPDRISVTSGDRSRIVTQDNVTGGTADGIVDSNLDLQGSYLTNYGPTTQTPRGAQY